MSQTWDPELYAALKRRGIDAAALDPWYFPTPGDYRARLEARGFRVEAMLLTPRPTVLPGDTGLSPRSTRGSTATRGFPYRHRLRRISA